MAHRQPGPQAGQYALTSGLRSFGLGRGDRLFLLHVSINHNVEPLKKRNGPLVLLCGSHTRGLRRQRAHKLIHTLQSLVVLVGIGPCGQTSSCFFNVKPQDTPKLVQFGRILGFYIEEARGSLAARPDTDQHDKRLQRVNELMRTLAPKTPGVAAAEQNQRSISFFERLDVVIDTYMQEKKPVAPAQAKAAKAGS